MCKTSLEFKGIWNIEVMGNLDTFRGYDVTIQPLLETSPCELRALIVSFGTHLESRIW